MEAQTQIAIFATPGMGHLIPLIELARRLLHLQTFSITIIIPYDVVSFAQSLKPLLQTLPELNTIFLPPPPAADFPENATIEDRIILSTIRSIPSLCESLSDLKKKPNRLSALIVDNFGVCALDSVKELGIPVYLFFLSNAFTLSLALHITRLDEDSDFPGPVQLPGCAPVRSSDLPDPIRERDSHSYRECVEVLGKYTSVDGILVNTFLDLEPATFKALDETGWPPVYPVGPLIRPGSGEEKADCLKWLDEQPDSSVLFVSFGSGGTLSTCQLEELALGLEMSEERFLFIVREPNDKIKNAAFFVDSKEKMNPNVYLPSGFIERTKGRGLVLSHWGPQVEILNHSSTGGFLSHCGWNSTLESIVHGVPMIAWPLFAEQRMNAVLLSEVLKVALRVKENENGIVDRDQVSMLVMKLMKEEVGEEIRTRMRNFKDGAKRALARDGSSTKSLANVAEKWKCETAL